MPDTIQAITRLPLNSSWSRSATPFLMSPYTLSTRHQRFACAHLQISHLTGSLSCLFPWRSPPWLLINAAHGGLVTTSGSRHRRAYLHLSHSYEQNFPALVAHQIPACGITAQGSSKLLTCTGYRLGTQKAWQIRGLAIPKCFTSSLNPSQL